VCFVRKPAVGGVAMGQGATVAAQNLERSPLGTLLCCTGISSSSTAAITWEAYTPAEDAKDSNGKTFATMPPGGPVGNKAQRLSTALAAAAAVAARREVTDSDCLQPMCCRAPPACSCHQACPATKQCQRCRIYTFEEDPIFTSGAHMAAEDVAEPLEETFRGHARGKDRWVSTINFAESAFTEQGPAAGQARLSQDGGSWGLELSKVVQAIPDSPLSPIMSTGRSVGEELLRRTLRERDAELEALRGGPGGKAADGMGQSFAHTEEGTSPTSSSSPLSGAGEGRFMVLHEPSMSNPAAPRFPECMSPTSSTPSSTTAAQQRGALRRPGSRSRSQSPSPIKVSAPGFSASRHAAALALATMPFEEETYGTSNFVEEEFDEEPKQVRFSEDSPEDNGLEFGPPIERSMNTQKLAEKVVEEAEARAAAPAAGHGDILWHLLPDPLPTVLRQPAPDTRQRQQQQRRSRPPYNHVARNV